MTEIERRLREALEQIMQRLNESGTGEIGLVDTINATYHMAKRALSLTPPAAEPTIPHPTCRTPSECRREEVCLDAWNCSASPRTPEGQ